MSLFFEKHRSLLVQLSMLFLASLFVFCFFFIAEMENPFAQKENFFPLFVLSFFASLVLLRFRRERLFSLYATVAFLFAAFFLMNAPPYFNDFWRYLWEGKVLLHGNNPLINTPYAITDADPLMVPEYWNLIFARWIPGIYPPTNLFFFWLAQWIEEDSAEMMKMIFFLLSLGTIGILATLLKTRRKDPRLIFFLALNPLFLFESLSSAHLDSILLFFLALSFFLLEKQKPILCGLSFAALVLTKFFPALLFPLFFRATQKKWLFSFAFLTGLALFYGPFFWGNNPKWLFAALTQFSQEWIQSPFLFAVTKSLTSFSGAKIILSIAVSLFSLSFFFRKSNNAMENAFFLLAFFLLSSSVIFSWYGLWLVFFLPFLSEKWQKALLVFSITLPFQYLLYTLDPVDGQWKFWKNGEIFWNQLLLFFPPMVAFFWAKKKQKMPPIFAPKISVIIPTFNEQKNISQTLFSIFKNSQIAFEIIISDGGSTDCTQEKVHNFLNKKNVHISFLKSPKKGRAAQMNWGAKKASGTVLFFLHADTILSKNTMEKITLAIKKGYIGGASKIEFHSSKKYFRGIEIFSNNRARWAKIFHGDQGIFVRRDVFEILNGFPEIPILEDSVFSQKMKKKGTTTFLSSPLITSARKIEKNGFWKSVGLYFFIKIGFSMGISAKRLKRFWK